MFSFGDIVFVLSACGGLSGIIGASGWAKAERIRAEGQAGKHIAPNDAILAQLRALQEQMKEMQSTGHQFDISFDAALSRLESRVNRLETKSAAQTAEEPPVQSVGRR